jgi:hypothetical protein
MFNGKMLTSIVVVFVMSMGFGLLVHGTLLAPEYAKLVPNLMRSQESAHGLFVWMLLATLSSSIAFCWIYVRGREAGKPWLGQGFRFGIAVAMLFVIPMFLINYVVMPFPSDLVAQQIVYESITTVILAIVVAWIHR